MRAYRGVLHIVVSALLVATGCGTAPQVGRSSRTIGSAVGEVTGTVVGRQYGETGVGRSVGSKLGTAAGAIAGSAIEGRQAQPPATAQSAAAQKFCPVGGEFYPASFVFCPLHGARLRDRSSLP